MQGSLTQFFPLSFALRTDPHRIHLVGVVFCLERLLALAAVKPLVRVLIQVIVAQAFPRRLHAANFTMGVKKYRGCGQSASSDGETV